MTIDIQVHHHTRYNFENFCKHDFENNWERACIDYYRLDYNFDEKTDDEIQIVKKCREKILSTVPEKYKTGIHHIGKGSCFMGEDLYIVDGKSIQHTIHVACEKCNNYSLLFRGKESICAICLK